MFIPLLVTYRCGFESMSFYKYKTKNSLLVGEPNDFSKDDNK